MSDDMKCRYKGSLLEADRCLQCYDPPCAKGCPAGVEVDRFIRHIAKGDLPAAAAIIEKDNPLGWICGYICPQESLCQQNCTSHKLGKGIDIKMLQQYAIAESRGMGEKNHSCCRAALPLQRLNIDGQIVEMEAQGRGQGKIAVIGAGPGGITAALYLRQMGYDVEVFEAQEEPGGRLTQGIPKFRLDPAMLLSELAKLMEPIRIKTGCALGKDFSLTQLQERGFKAIYISAGKWRENKLPLPGADLPDVFGSSDVLLSNDWQDKGYRKAAIIGAGNVAMDVAMVLKEGGVDEVNIFFIAANAEVTAWADAREEAFGQGVILHMLSIPEEIIAQEGRVSGLRFSRAQVHTGENGAWRVTSLQEQMNYVYPVDMVVFSIGYATERDMLARQGLELDRAGHILVDGNLRTNLDGVYAGGDIIGRGAVVQAIGDAKRAALAIHEHLSAKEGE